MTDRGKKVAKTAKRGTEISLPANPTHVIQPNRITEAVYSATLIQERIFTAIMYYLQNPIQMSMKDESYRQLNLFNDENELTVHIPLREIAHPRQYKEVREAASRLGGVQIKIPFKNAKGKSYTNFTNLFSVTLPDAADYSSTIAIHIKKTIAEKLIDIDKDTNKRPINYTRFVYEIAQQAKSQFTPRLYKIISSWKKKGGFVITLAELKHLLGVGDKYRKYSDFKRRVLVPAHDELFEKADCWFNVNAKDFEERKGKEVVRLHFKVITPEFNKLEDSRANQLINILKTHFRFTPEDMGKIAHIIDDPDIPIAEVTHKVMSVSEYLATNSEVKFPKQYLIKSLIAEFGE